MFSTPCSGGAEQPVLFSTPYHSSKLPFLQVVQLRRSTLQGRCGSVTISERNASCGSFTKIVSGTSKNLWTEKMSTIQQSSAIATAIRCMATVIRQKA